MSRHVRQVMGVMAFLGLGFVLTRAAGTAGDAKGPDKAALERTRDTVMMLDDLYKNAVVSITNHYVEGQASNPAIFIAQDIFAAMSKKGWHQARLIDATGKPRNKANVAKTDFEKNAVDAMKKGKPYYEEVAEVNGKHVLRAATVVPVVMKQCAVCHGKKEGELLGTIVYEINIK
jgi:hypothetical protein